MYFATILRLQTFRKTLAKLLTMLLFFVVANIGLIMYRVQNSPRVKAIRHHKAQDATQLDFNKGDIITLTNRDAAPENGQLVH